MVVAVRKESSTSLQKRVQTRKKGRQARGYPSVWGVGECRFAGPVCRLDCRFPCGWDAREWRIKRAKRNRHQTAEKNPIQTKYKKTTPTTIPPKIPPLASVQKKKQKAVLWREKQKETIKRKFRLLTTAYARRKKMSIKPSSTVLVTFAHATKNTGAVINPLKHTNVIKKQKIHQNKKSLQISDLTVRGNRVFTLHCCLLAISHNNSKSTNSQQHPCWVVGRVQQGEPPRPDFQKANQQDSSALRQFHQSIQKCLLGINAGPVEVPKRMENTKLVDRFLFHHHLTRGGLLQLPLIIINANSWVLKSNLLCRKKVTQWGKKKKTKGAFFKHKTRQGNWTKKNKYLVASLRPLHSPRKAPKPWPKEGHFTSVVWGSGIGGLIPVRRVYISFTSSVLHVICSGNMA